MTKTARQSALRRIDRYVFEIFTGVLNVDLQAGGYDGMQGSLSRPTGQQRPAVAATVRTTASRSRS